MGTSQQIVQLIERIQAALEEFKGETKQQFSSNIDQENWKAVAVLNDCASWIDEGIGACDRMRVRLDSLGEAGVATVTDDQMTASSPGPSAQSSDENEPHPFWPTFFELGEHIHPELRNKTPTGGRRKIGPTILPGIQIDVAYSSRGVSCRLLSMKREKLEPLLKLKPQFAEAVKGEIEWHDRKKNRSHLSVTVRPASNLDQQGWPIEEKARNLLKLYGQIKQFVFENLE
jgi:hypothetical protein